MKYFRTNYGYVATIEEGVDGIEISKEEFDSHMVVGVVDEVAVKKAIKVEDIDAYDVSSAVNSFSYQGQEFWIDKATRVGLVNSTNALIASGANETTIWFGTFHVTLPCSQVLEMLNAIEIYAIACYNTTARHKAEVSQLTSIEDIEAYDITEGYPQRLVF